MVFEFAIKNGLAYPFSVKQKDKIGSVCVTSCAAIRG
jgi:hypothetical protein